LSREASIKDGHLEIFTRLDDTDILSAVKVWATHDDLVLTKLCNDFVRRNLFHVDITTEAPNQLLVKTLSENAISKYGITENEIPYFVFTGSITNNAYRVGDGNIGILMKDGNIIDIATASDYSNLEALAKTVEKYILCYSKELIDED